MKNKKEFKNIIVILVVVFCSLLGMILSNKLFPIIGFAICCIVAICFKTDDLLCILLFLMPFNTIFKISPGETSLFTLFTLIVVVILFFKRKIEMSKLSISCAFLILLIVLFSDLFNNNFSIFEYIKQMCNFILVFIACNSLIKKNISTKFILYFSVGVVMSSVIALFADIIPNFYVYVNKVGVNPLITNRFSGLNGDPNYYSVNVILSIFGLMIEYQFERINKIFWIFFLVLTFFGFATYSKSFMLIWCVCLLYFLINIFKFKNVRSLITIICIIIFILVLFRNNLQKYVEVILERFGDDNDISSITTGRSELWKIYLIEINSNLNKLIFGAGIGAELIRNSGVHNLYIEMLYYFGVFGSLAIFFSYICMLYDVLKFNKGLTSMFAFLLLLIMYFFLQMVHSNETPFQLIMAASIYCSFISSKK